MPKDKPTYDDLVSTLYDIWEIANAVVFENDLECVEEPPSITRIMDICEQVLPD